MAKLKAELIEWLDITAHSKEDPFSAKPEIVRSHLVGFYIKSYDLFGVKFLRYCYNLPHIPYQDEGDFVDIPEAVIIKRKVLKEVDITVGLEFEDRKSL